MVSKAEPLKMKNEKLTGFTLVEFLVIFAIMAIMAGVSWTGFLFLQPAWQLNAVSRDLAGDLRFAQQMAVTEQVEHAVRFATSTGEYQIIRYGADTQVLLAKSLPGDIDFKEIAGFSDGEAIFNPYGAVREPGSVSLVNSKEEVKTIEVRPSGFVKIK